MSPFLYLQAGDILPSSQPGILVAVADRLDSLVGLTAAVGAPSATADPYGLRRSAYGMLQVRLRAWSCSWGMSALRKERAHVLSRR